MSTAVERDALVAYLDDYLQTAEGRDYGPNGLQVEGSPRIERLATGVSACAELFEAARAWKAEAVLVHHGLFWTGMPYQLVGVQRRRVGLLVEADVNLLAYHLPLDRHPVVGNNAVACHRLGLEALRPFARHEGLPIGFAGRFSRPVGRDELRERVEQLYGQATLAFLAGPDMVETVGIVSGGAQKELYQAIEEGLDAFVTGEVSEWVMNLAREAGIHYLAAGHYATERLGVQCLGEHLAARFGLDVRFFDVPNPV